MSIEPRKPRGFIATRAAQSGAANEPIANRKVVCANVRVLLRERKKEDGLGQKVVHVEHARALGQHLELDRVAAARVPRRLLRARGDVVDHGAVPDERRPVDTSRTEHHTTRQLYPMAVAV